MVQADRTQSLKKSIAGFLMSVPVILSAASIEPGQSVYLSYTAGKPAPRVTARTHAGETLRFTLDQGNEDLAVTITLPDSSVMQLNQFEFGPEKITLICSTNGVVQITVSAAKSDLEAADFSILLESHPTVPEDEAEARAEGLASRAKSEARQASGQDTPTDLLLEEIDTWDKLGDKAAVARARIALGDWYYGRSNWEAARQEYAIAKERCGEFVRCRVEAVNNIGSASRNLGDIDESAKQLSEAAEGWQKLKLPQLEARTLSNLGLLHLQTSEFSLALIDFDKARALLTAAKSPTFLATILNNTGLVYLALERYRDASSYFERALTATSHDADRIKIQGRVRINIGHAHMLAGMLTTARNDEDAALKLAIRASDISAQADALDNSGQIEYRLGHLAAAENLFHQALVLYQQVGSPRGFSSTLFFLGLLMAERGDYNEARAELEQSLEMRLSRRLQNEAAETLYQLAILEGKRGNRERSLIFAEKAIKAAESLRIHAAGPSSRGSLFAARRKYFEYLVEETLKDGNNSSKAAAAAFLFVERARARILADTLGDPSAVNHSDSPYSSERRRLWRQIEFKSSRLARTQVNQELESEAQDLRDDIARMLLLDDQLAASLVSEPHSLQPVEMGTLQSEFLEKDDAFLEFWLGEHRSFLWIIRRNHVKVCTLPARKQIAHEVKSLLALLGDINGRRAYPQKQKAFQDASGRFSRELGLVFDGPAPARVLIVADGVLNRLPFAMLPLMIRSRNGSLRSIGAIGLVTKLLQSPSAAVFTALHSPRGIGGGNEVIAFGDPVYSSDDARVVKQLAFEPPLAKASGLTLARLVFSRIEMETVSEVTRRGKPRAFTGFAATRERFLSEIRGASGLVLISTHVLVDDDQPALSSIVLSMVDQEGKPRDGLVHLYDLTNGKLKLNSALMVLSTCDGAGGQELELEGLQSLARGFILAGAGSVVASVTKVDAEGTAYFVRWFLQSLLGTSHGHADKAMLAARREAAASKRWKDPYYWSTFVLTGGIDREPPAEQHIK